MPIPKIEMPHLVIFFGMVASGKSHLARRWARLHHCPYHNTDIVRKELFGLAPTRRQQEGVRQGIYSAKHTEKTYLEMIRLAELDLDERGRSLVVLDGSYIDERERARLVQRFFSRCDIVFVYCFCSEVETRRRLERRAVDPDAVSDGRWPIYLHQREGFVVPEVITGARLLLINTEADTDELLGVVDTCVSATITSAKRQD